SRLAQGADPSRVYYGTDTRAQSLLVGAALGAAVAGGLRTTSKKAAATAGWPGLGIAGLGPLHLVGAAHSAPGDSPRRLPFPPPAVAFLIFASTQPGGGMSNPIRSALSFTPLRGLGLISYGVYIYHWPIFVILNPDRTHLTGNRLVLLRVVVTLAVATASYF